MMRALHVGLGGALLAGVLLSVVVRPAAPVVACTGGGYGPLEDLVDRSRYVFVADAIEVGDRINRAPTLVPTATATATPLFAVRTPVSPPAQQAVPRPTSGPFDVSGFGATLRVVDRLLGDPPSVIAIDAADRADVERVARQSDAGSISDCAPDYSTFRYRVDGRYLVFIGDRLGLGEGTVVRFEIVGSDVLVYDGSAQGLSMSADTYARYFSPVAFRGYLGGPFGMIDTNRVPLDAMLKSIAFLSGRAPIAPPEAGSGGFLAGARR